MGVLHLFLTSHVHAILADSPKNQVATPTVQGPGFWLVGPGDEFVDAGLKEDDGGPEDLGFS